MHYLAYWSLTEPPFGEHSSKRFFAGGAQREAIARLHCLIAGGISSGVLLSPSGCGATSLFRHVAASHGFGDCAVEMLLTNGDQPTRERVAVDLSGAARLRPCGGSRAEQLDWAIAATSRQGIRTVWMIDGCNKQAAEFARSLLDRRHRLSVVMGTEPEDAGRLAITLGHCPLKIELPPWELSDTTAFVKHALITAGTQRQIYSDAAVVRLHEIGQGRVGIISSVAELAMIVGAAKHVDQISPELVEAVQEELVRAAA